MKNYIFLMTMALALSGSSMAYAKTKSVSGAPTAKLTAAPIPPVTGATVPLISTAPATAVVSTAPAPIVPGHPAISEVDQRLINQQARINAGVADGQLSQQQALLDEQNLQKTALQLNADEAKDGGGITAAQAASLNASLNQNGADIYGQRAVSRFDNTITNQQNRINAGVADGKIDQQQAALDDSNLTNVEQQMSNDEAGDGGLVTRQEGSSLEKSLSLNGDYIYGQTH